MSENKTIFCDCSDMRDHVIDIRHYDDGDAWMIRSPSAWQ